MESSARWPGPSATHSSAMPTGKRREVNGPCGPASTVISFRAYVTQRKHAQRLHVGTRGFASWVRQSATAQPGSPVLQAV